MPGNGIEQADAEQAYVQANLKGKDTWILLPEEAWPDNWFKTDAKGAVDRSQPKYVKPVFRLYKALYGHPDSGTMWEQHCHQRLLKIGFKPVPEWPSCYFNHRRQLFLTVYVDDLKLSGRRFEALRETNRIDVCQRIHGF